METRRISRFTILLLCVLMTGITSIAYGNILDDLEITPGIRFWGADLEVNYKGISFFPSLTTRLCIILGGGYETPGYYRDSTDMQYDPDDPDEQTNRALFKRTEFLAAFGIRQGIVFDPKKNDNLLEGYFFCRLLYSDYNEDNSEPGSLIFTTGAPDTYGIFLTTFAIGLYFNSTIIHETHRKRNGISADFSIEYGPGGLNNSKGDAEFTRVTVDIRGYLTLIDLDSRENKEKNLFNLYICNRILSDGLVGRYIPIVARQTVGGRDLKANDGLGGIMRGIESRRFDGYLKIVHNFDVRCDLPTLRTIVPGIVLYFDTGIADNLNYDLKPENIHYSTGLGIFVRGLGFNTIGYANYWIDGEKFSFSFDFKLHF